MSVKLTHKTCLLLAMAIFSWFLLHVANANNDGNEIAIISPPVIINDSAFVKNQDESKCTPRNHTMLALKPSTEINLNVSKTRNELVLTARLLLSLSKIPVSGQEVMFFEGNHAGSGSGAKYLGSIETDRDGFARLKIFDSDINKINKLFSARYLGSPVCNGGVSLGKLHAIPDSITLKDNLPEKNQIMKYDFNGDGEYDRFRIIFFGKPGGFQCCTYVNIELEFMLSGTKDPIRLPLEIDGLYLPFGMISSKNTGIDLSKPEHFNIDDFDNDGVPELFLEVFTDKGKLMPIPDEFKSLLGINEHRIWIDLSGGVMKIHNIP